MFGSIVLHVQCRINPIIRTVTRSSRDKRIDKSNNKLKVLEGPDCVFVKPMVQKARLWLGVRHVRIRSVPVNWYNYFDSNEPKTDNILPLPSLEVKTTNPEKKPSIRRPTWEVTGASASLGADEPWHHHINQWQRSQSFCPWRGFVNRPAKFVSPSSFPTRRIPAAAASQTAW